MKSDENLHTLFGRLEHLVHEDSPDPDTALGAAGGSLLSLLAAFGIGQWTQVDTAATGLGIYRARREPTLLCVAADSLVETVQGTAVEGPGLAGFDSRSGRVLLRVHSGDGCPFVVDASDGVVDIWAVPDLLAGLDPPAADAPPLPAPEVATWGAAAAAEGWLVAHATRLAESPSRVERAAAAGQLARLWAAPAETSIDAPAHPRERVRAWARALGAEQLGLIETDAVERAWSLADRLAEVDALTEAEARLEVPILIRERDELQGARRLLRLADEGARLSDALVLVDRVAARNLSALTGHLPDLDEDPDAERWLAVAWQEPEAWWSGLG